MKTPKGEFETRSVFTRRRACKTHTVQIAGTNLWPICKSVRQQDLRPATAGDPSREVAPTCKGCLKQDPRFNGEV